jgi:hypothetical protein
VEKKKNALSAATQLLRTVAGSGRNLGAQRMLKDEDGGHLGAPRMLEDEAAVILKLRARSKMRDRVILELRACSKMRKTGVRALSSTNFGALAVW